MFFPSIWSFSHLRSVFLDRVIHFGETLGDQVKGPSPKSYNRSKSFPMYCKWKRMFLASIWSLSHFRSVFLDRVIHFGETLGDHVKGRSPTKLKSLIEVPHVVHVKVHVLSFNILSRIRSVFSHRVIHFGKNLGDKVKGRSPKKLKT